MKKSILVLALAIVSTLFLYWCAQKNIETNNDQALLNDTRDEVENTEIINDILTPTETTEVVQETDTNGKIAWFTYSDVAMHADVNSCWTVIDGNVYDLTSWASQHPGWPEAIAQLCGKDGTAAFQWEHWWQVLQEETLATFKIGIHNE